MRPHKEKPHKEWTCPPLSGGHVHFLCQGVGWWPDHGTCSFFPRDMLNFRGKGWACGGYVQGSGRAESMSREPWAGLGQSGDMHILVWATQGAYSFLPGACSFISGSTGRRGQAPGTCSIFAARSGHMGDKSRLRRVRRACPLGCGLGWANSGACSFLAGPTLEHAHSCQGQPSFIADSIGASGPTREHAQFCGKGWASGGYVQASGCGEGMSRGFWSWLGQSGDMLIVAAGHAHSSRRGRGQPGGHAHSSRQSPDIGGICPGLGGRGGHVQR